MANVKHIYRVAFFLNMNLAHAELTSGSKPLKDDAVLFSFQGSGARDALTVGEVRRFLFEAKSVRDILKGVKK